jgi:ankyrin repeat protein
MRKLFNFLSYLRPNRRDDKGRTRLYKAAKHGNLSEVKRLLSAGADPNVPNYRGLTPLHQAAYWGELNIAKELLIAGANPKATNGRGWTPLHSASLSAGLSGRRHVIQLLLKLGADPHAIDKYGWAPVDYTALWEDQNPKLSKILNFLKQLAEAEDTQQPDMDKLGMDKLKENDKDQDPCTKTKKTIDKDCFPKH